MPQIIAETDPHIPFYRGSFWLWELINISVPLVGIFFLDWSIFSIVFLFYVEILCWGAVGVLKIISANGAPGIILKLTTRIGSLFMFVLLYMTLSVLVISFSFVEFSSDSVINTATGIGGSMIIIAANYLLEYFRGEIMTGRFRTRLPLEVLFERFFYALPLAALILFLVIPAAQKFEGGKTEMVIAVGIILSKFIMDTAMHYLPGIALRPELSQVEKDSGDQLEI